VNTVSTVNNSHKTACEQ